MNFQVQKILEPKKKLSYTKTRSIRYKYSRISIIQTPIIRMLAHNFTVSYIFATF